MIYNTVEVKLITPKVCAHDVCVKVATHEISDVILRNSKTKRVTLANTCDEHFNEVYEIYKEKYDMRYDNHKPKGNNNEQEKNKP
tara:strand:+ start:96 stop:350 length:255 start_codon:yes stop_codon:yes gene_type:complete